MNRYFRFACIAVLSALPPFAHAATVTVNGVTWTYDVYNGYASIGGTSAAISTSTKGAITIPSTLGGCPVTRILDIAFYNCSGLTSVTIPDSVTSIGLQAFYGCSGLTSVTIPDSVTSIGLQAFYGCSGLMSVTIPGSVTSIGGSAFSNCSGLKSFMVSGTNPNYASVNGLLLSKDGKTLISGVNGDVVIPDSVASIGEGAFSGRIGLTSVTIPNSVTSIGVNAFSNCNSTLYDTTTVPSVKLVDGWAVGYESSLSGTLALVGTRGIGDRAFYNCNSLTSLTIPGSVMSIGVNAFSYCSDLMSVTIPGSVTSIGNSAFFSCSRLELVTIQDGVTRIGDNAFSDCSSLYFVTIPDSVTSIGSNAFSGCRKALYWTNSGVRCVSGWAVGYESSLSGDLDLAGYRGIGDRAFFQCKSLSSVTIPASVKSIGNSAFSGCLFTSVTIGNGVTSIGEGAFISCENLTSVEIPDSVTNIGNGAFFNCYNLRSVTIPASVTSIGEYAFRLCSRLTSVTVPDSVTFLGNNAFDGCSTLSDLYLPAHFEGHTDAMGIPDGCTVHFGMPEPAPEPEPEPHAELTETIHGITWWFYIEEEETVVTGADPVEGAIEIPSTLGGCAVVAIGEEAFANCTNLTSMTIPEGVTNIGSWAFQDCSGLVSVAIPDSVVRIGSSAFWGCTGLTSLCFGAGIARFGYQPFWGCDNLAFLDVDSQNVTYRAVDGYLLSKDGITLAYAPPAIQKLSVPAGVESIGEEAFSHCLGLTSIAIPSGVTNLSSWAFEYCENLVTAILPEGVASIGQGVFDRCVNLSSIVIPDSVTSVGEAPFGWSELEDNGSGLRYIVIPDSLVDDVSNWDLNAWCRVIPRSTLEGETTASGIPHEWFYNYGSIIAEYGEQYGQAAVAKSANGRNTVGDCYVAGLDPTSVTDVFRTIISIGVDGAPVIGWEPDLNEGGTKHERVYTVEGRESLTEGSWGPTDAVSRFFRVRVSMP